MLVIAESVINRALALDPATQKKLATIEGQVLQLCCTSPIFQANMLFCTNSVLIQANLEGDFTTRISGSGPELVKLLTSGTSEQSPAAGGVTFEGDASLLQILQSISQQLDIDWHTELAKYIGDVPAQHLGNGMKALFNWGASTLSSLQFSAEEFLHHEIRATPTKVELDYFYQDVQDIKTKIDRAAARLEALGVRLDAIRPQADTIP